jgi:heterodisulfide reductase subunit A
VTVRETRGDQGDPASAAGRTGLFFCRCGPNLGTVVRIGELEAARWPAADVATHGVLCSPEGQAWLAERIRSRGLARVVIAACSPREHEHTFRKVLAGTGRSPWHLAMVNLREQVEWQGGDPAAATARAGRLVSAALARVALQRAIPAEEVEVSADVLVLGGGAAGLSAALTLAGRGRKVIVAERAFVLGGLANQLDAVFPDLECASCFLEPVLDRVLHDPRVEVLTGAEVRRVRGAAGRFEVDLELRPRGVDPAACLGCGACAAACPVERPDPWSAGLGRARAVGLPYPGCLPHVSVLDADACLRGRGQGCELCAQACAFGAVRLDDAPRARTVTVGAVVVATGHAPGEVPEVDGVVSSWRLERMLHPDGPTRGAVVGAGGRTPASVLLVADADEDGDLPGRELLKLARIVKTRLPAARVTVAGGLDRIPALRRDAAAVAREGIALVPGRLAAPPLAAGGGVAVRLADGAGGAPEAVAHADLVVIHGAGRPADGTADLARLLRIATGDRGFLLDRASPFEPTATRIAGIYVAGAAAGPRPLADAIRDGAAAAGLVHASLVPGEKRALEPLAAEIDAARCGGCGVCVSTCAFGALVLRDGKAIVEAVHCRGCGGCAAACPTGAAAARHFTRAQLEAEISALLSSGRDG